MLRRILTVAVGVLLAGDLVGLVALPSGARHLSGVIPEGNRVIVSRSLGTVRVLVLEHGKDLRLLVAYKEHRRWHSVKVDPAPATSNAAWAATKGAGPVPAFSAVYGRTDVARVVVRWSDGKTSDVVPVKGAYLAVRRGHITPDGVDLTPAPAP
jgi:hypothetical protein